MVCVCVCVCMCACVRVCVHVYVHVGGDRTASFKQKLMDLDAEHLALDVSHCIGEGDTPTRN